jgi:hypothetical protein
MSNIPSIIVEFPMKNWLHLQLDDIIKVFGLTLYSKPNLTLMFSHRENEISEDLEEHAAKGSKNF